jgi:pimeloyl-ACP methyl ester carboxylesterase
MVEVGFFRSGELRLRYLTRGDRGQPAVICLHGGAHTAHVWDDLAARLCDRWFVVALDQRGHGDSDWSLDARYHVDDFVADIAALLAHLGLERAAFVTHSLGSNNALRFAALHPASVTRLVIADKGPEMGPEYAWGQGDDIANPPRKASREAFIEEAFRRNPRRGRAFYEWLLTPNLRQCPDGRWTWKYDPRFMQYTMWQDRENWAVIAEKWRLLAEVRRPVLILRGERSRALTEEIARRMVDTLADARYRSLPDAGHNVHLDAPDAFAAAVIAFLEED